MVLFFFAGCSHPSLLVHGCNRRGKMKSSRFLSVLILVGIMLSATMVPGKWLICAGSLPHLPRCCVSRMAAVANASDGFALSSPATLDPVQSRTPATTRKRRLIHPAGRRAGEHGHRPLLAHGHAAVFRDCAGGGWIWQQRRFDQRRAVRPGQQHLVIRGEPGHRP